MLLNIVPSLKSGHFKSTNRMFPLGNISTRTFHTSGIHIHIEKGEVMTLSISISRIKDLPQPHHSRAPSPFSVQIPNLCFPNLFQSFQNTPLFFFQPSTVHISNPSSGSRFHHFPRITNPKSCSLKSPQTYQSNTFIQQISYPASHATRT